MAGSPVNIVSINVRAIVEHEVLQLLARMGAIPFSNCISKRIAFTSRIKRIIYGMTLVIR